MWPKEILHPYAATKPSRGRFHVAIARPARHRPQSKTRGIENLSSPYKIRRIAAMHWGKTVEGKQPACPLRKRASGPPHEPSSPARRAQLLHRRGRIFGRERLFPLRIGRLRFSKLSCRGSDGFLRRNPKFRGAWLVPFDFPRVRRERLRVGRPQGFPR